MSGRSLRVIKRRLLRRVPTQVKLIWDKTKAVVPSISTSVEFSIETLLLKKLQLNGTETDKISDFGL